MMMKRKNLHQNAVLILNNSDAFIPIEHQSQNIQQIQEINVIINKTMVRLPHAYVTLADFVSPVYALWFYCSQSFKLFGFPIFLFLAYLMKVIPEMRRAH